MSQFTLYKNENKSSNKTYPYLVDVQNDFFDELNSRIVIPLSPHNVLNQTNAKKLCPIITIDDEQYVLLTHQMTSMPKTMLRKKVTSIENLRYEILGAIDFLVTSI
ncbi:MAG: CcdB family protein [gamma proteobacterium symbiont of Bathyaustriella thionipta]|nr:CcdB family protein [gamma proteobacterium symbiont of Bathyaustriella thionipta]MCU7951379.1 CcdB family protein [gamma proteobacterium symbiont of Bathyaustriella thionipta]MCU7957932.1 CcdB family protein [gamma proteobacterium symbiont of Bathyaustriella thionipta]MCU7965738.1 CcdB family protein [gamma proteobacterium symbiont of Bathyaustriella thionipta]